MERLPETRTASILPRVYTDPPELLSATLHTVAIVVELMRQRGVPAALLLENTGITTEMLREPVDLISRAQELQVFANALYRGGEAAIGLIAGRTMHMPSYGILGYAMMVSSNLGAALRHGFSFPVLLGSYFRLSIQVRRGEAHMVASHYHYRPDLERFNTDMCLASLWSIVCDALGAQRTPLAVNFCHDRPDYASQYERIFGCRVNFGANENSVVFPGEWLDHTLPFAEAVSCGMALAQCERLEREWAQASGNSTTAHVLRLLNADPQRYRSIDDAAGALYMSGRTLRRRLQQAQVRFQALQDQVLQDKALDLLARGHQSITQIAHGLGFSEPASFRQAFRRWTGMSPSEWRRARRSGNP